MNSYKLEKEDYDEIMSIFQTCKDFTDKELEKVFNLIKQKCKNYREFRITARTTISIYPEKEYEFYLKKVKEMIEKEIDSLEILDCQ